MQMSGEKLKGISIFSLQCYNTIFGTPTGVLMSIISPLMYWWSSLLRTMKEALDIQKFSLHSFSSTGFPTTCFWLPLVDIYVDSVLGTCVSLLMEVMLQYCNSTFCWRSIVKCSLVSCTNRTWVSAIVLVVVHLLAHGCWLELQYVYVKVSAFRGNTFSTTQNAVAL